MKKLYKVLGVLTALLVLFALSGCQKEDNGLLDNKSTTCGNIVMGQGTFAYENGFIYFADGNDIYEYDMETGKTIVINAKSIGMYSSLYSQGQYIYFANSGLSRITKDGKKIDKVFERNGSCYMLYIDGTDAYYIDGIGGSMYHRDLESDKETEILLEVEAYYVDDKNVYAIAKTDGVNHLFISGRDQIDFKEVELSFVPIKVFAANGCLYMAEQGKWQIIKHSSEGEERLPIYSYYYQVIGDKIIYQEDQESGFDLLMIYDMAAGERETICENVSNFNVFDDKFVCIDCVNNEAGRFEADGHLIYDLETKEIIAM